MVKVVTIVGARPQFVKAAVLSRKIKEAKWKNKFKETIIHTGQHYDINMSKVFFDEMKIPNPNYNIKVGSRNHGEMTGYMIIEIEKLLIKLKPNFVIVYGDTNTTLAGAISTSKLEIPLVHIEAGLRSHNKKMPEEQNRILTDHLSDILFCPSENACANLKKEGITNGVYNVGDIMHDAFKKYSNLIKNDKKKRFTDILKKYKIKHISNKEFYLLTIHRAENTDNKEIIYKIADAINSIEQNAIFPIHPRTLKILKKYRIKLSSKINMIEPISYLEMLVILDYCKFVITDSGGMQKEAYYSDKPCLTIRNETEWVETLKYGWNYLAGSDKKMIIETASKIQIPKKKVNYYGKGNTSDKILSHLLKY